MPDTQDYPKLERTVVATVTGLGSAITELPIREPLDEMQNIFDKYAAWMKLTADLLDFVKSRIASDASNDSEYRKQQLRLIQTHPDGTREVFFLFLRPGETLEAALVRSGFDASELDRFEVAHTSRSEPQATTDTHATPIVPSRPVSAPNPAHSDSPF